MQKSRLLFSICCIFLSILAIPLHAQNPWQPVKVGEYYLPTDLRRPRTGLTNKDTPLTQSRAASAHTTPPYTPDSLKQSVVRIHSLEESARGWGVVVGENIIYTVAHLVKSIDEIVFVTYQDSLYYSAIVDSVNSQMDIARLHLIFQLSGNFLDEKVSFNTITRIIPYIDYTPEPIVGGHYAIIVNGTEEIVTGTVPDRLEKKINSILGYTGEILVTYKPNRKGFLGVSGSPVLNHQGKVVGIFTGYINIKNMFYMYISQ